MSAERVGGLRYVTFSSCGPKMLAFAGVIRALRDAMPDFDAWRNDLRGVAGTSGGAVVALALAIGVDEERLLKLRERFLHFTSVVGKRMDIGSVVHNFGLDDGQTMREMVDEMLTTGGLSAGCTLADLERLLRMRTVFVAHCLETGTVVHFSAETHPTSLVRDVVYASCCVPLAFCPFVDPATGLHYVDGAVSERVPNVFPPSETLHVFLPAPSFFDEKEGGRRVRSWFDFANALSLAMWECQRDRERSLAASRSAVVVDEAGALDSFMADSLVMDEMKEEAALEVERIGYASAFVFLHPAASEELGRCVSSLLSSLSSLSSRPSVRPPGTTSGEVGQVVVGHVSQTSGERAPGCELSSEDD